MSNEKQQIDVRLVTEIRDAGRHETIVIESSGMKYKKNDSLFLSFEENLEGIDKVKTIMKLTENELFIMRSGGVTMRQNFRVGELLAGSYQSPYGTMAMETKTERIHYQFNDKKREGKLDLAYRLKMQAEEAGRYRLTLTYKEV
ncbi:DUF1934 domain-containing protein [Bacillus solimangrovi]|uniref:DUF1934 domain-containing protein n=1 Tax=Bacillus solimangrovi TaxID=1305675 RepID=A0A1E5LGN4_9BACI|nr:DUF1934 domain-containing protein [Bacillus solimangrovi]OEH93239.1 hypothetical protein BFG57_12615 [Bacillus solimangrovi]